MRVIFNYILVTAFLSIVSSCKKDKSCKGCINGNKPPTAFAGPDQVIILPADSVSLDGSALQGPTSVPVLNFPEEEKIL